MKFMKTRIPLLLLVFIFITGGLVSCEEDDRPRAALTVLDFDFSAEEVNTLKVSFTNESENAASYSWDFGDGSGLVTDENPTHQYVKGGTYNVILTGTGESGNVKKVSREVILTTPNTNPGFTYTNELNSAIVIFTNTSTNADSYSWDFGDGSDLVTEENPTHEFPGAGTYTVVLTATDSEGIFEQVTSSEEITIEIVKADFSYTNEANSLIVNFTNTSEFASSYSWDFGDGTAASTEENPVHEYAGAGTYRVILTVTGLGSFTAKDSTDITVTTAGFVAGPGDVFDFFTGVSSDANVEWVVEPAITLEHGIDFQDEKVGKYTRSGSVGSSFDKIFVRPLPGDVDWTERTVFSIDVYFPSSNTYSDDRSTGITKNVEFRLRQDKTDGSGSDSGTEIRLIKEVPTLDDWVTIEFDMSGAAHWSGDPAFDPGAPYTTLIIMLGRDGGLFEGEFYLKNFKRL